MARLANRKATYRAAELFRDQCLAGRASLLWPSTNPWTLSNLRSLRSAILDHLDTSERKFFDKLKDQLAPESAEVSQIATDLLAFYYLFTISIGAGTKLNNLRRVVSWKKLDEGLNLSVVEDAYSEGGIGTTGQYYNTGIPFLFVFLIQFSIEALQRNPDFGDMRALEELCDTAEKEIPKSTAAIRNATLHMLAPELFENISSPRHKRRLLEGFYSLDPGSGTQDARILQVREALAAELRRPAFDFYDSDVIPRWDPDADVEPESEAETAGQRVWIEKTRVKGLPARLAGPHAVGQALWSPQRSDGGADIYRFMRDVKPGDVVLHLTDNQAFTGISRVAAPADDKFTGLPNTEWAGKRAYRVQLRGYRELDPALDRATFFAEPFGSELRRIAADGTKNLFFNSEPSLNQGAYLTPAPDRVIRILNEAYQSIARRDLVDATTISSDDSVEMRHSSLASIAPRGDLAEVCTAFSAALRTSGVTFGGRHEATVRSFVVSLATKRFVILTGLSGSGKTQLALRFGEWLGRDRLQVVAVRPDWTGAEALFGFEDALQRAEQGRRSWQVPEALKFMLRAARDPGRPYLLLLDEMNLAHVERYFADVLSAMESEQRCLPNVALEPDGQWRQLFQADSHLAVPSNLFVVGTVNVDETTYMFSPKVLDRANTFEFRVDTGDLVNEARRPVRCEEGDPSLVARFAEIAADPDWHNAHPAPRISDFVSLFKKLHHLLVPFGFEYGHRTFVEAVRFASLLAAAGDVEAMDALDLQVMQKILPRIHGARKRIEPVLRRVGQFCLDPSSSLAADDLQAGSFDPMASVDGQAKLPISFEKIRRMTAIVRANQFVSFTE